MTARKLSRRAALRGGVAASALVAAPAIARAEEADPVIVLARRFNKLKEAAYAAQDRFDELSFAVPRG